MGKQNTYELFFVLFRNTMKLFGKFSLIDLAGKNYIFYI